MILRYHDLVFDSPLVILTSSLGNKPRIIRAKSRTILRSRLAEKWGASRAFAKVRFVDCPSIIPYKKHEGKYFSVSQIYFGTFKGLTLIGGEKPQQSRFVAGTKAGNRNFALNHCLEKL